MILPDSRCEVHGETLSMYRSVDRGRIAFRTYCKSCRREQVRARNGGLKYNSPLDERCRNGHPKTPFNYGLYGGKKRCIVCSKSRGRLKR